MGWFRDTFSGFEEAINTLPRSFVVAMKVSIWLAMLVFFLVQIGTMTYDMLAPHLPASPEAIDNARRRLELERVKSELRNLESSNYANERAAKARAEIDLEVYRTSSGASAAAMPRPIVNKLYGVMIKTVEDPETTRRLAAGGADIVTSKSPDEFATFLMNQTEFWAKIVKAVGATAE